jgi:phosphatidyl-myo-inositol dimannoside synthase
VKPVDLLLSQDFFPQLGGAHSWLYEIYRRWPTRVDALVRNYPDASAAQAAFDARDHGSLHLTRADIAVDEINLLKPASWRSMLRVAARLHSMRAGRPARIHCLRAFPEGFCGLLARMRRPRSSRLVVYAHGEEILVARSSRQLQLMARAVYAGADLVIANSQNTVRLVRELCPSARVACVHPGVDVRAFQIDPQQAREFRRRWGWPEDTTIVSTIARMEPRKNQAAVLHAVAKLHAAGRRVGYVCAGDGEERANLERLARELGIADRVRFPGALSEGDKLLTYAASDVYAMPSIQAGEMIEGFGIVFLEAAAAGIPAICGSIGGQPEAVQADVTGVVVDGKDDAAVTAALDRLVADPQLRVRMGTAARARAARFDLALVSDAAAGNVERHASAGAAGGGVRRKWVYAALAAVAAGALWLGLAHHYRLAPLAFLKESARVVAAPVAALFGADDVERVERTAAGYRVGAPVAASTTPRASWLAIERALPGFRLAPDSALPALPSGIPFVYQDRAADYLQRFRATYRLAELVRDAPDEYQAMLRLGAWLGTQWDHGIDTLPDDSQVCDPVAVVEKGRNGAKYWCEVAARTLVHAASALGWQARLITGSSDGYTWEHAVAELWSNQFGKWFVIDADFNVVYESGGVPLSAFELHSRGRELRDSGQLVVRPIAPPKASLPPADVLPLYAYIHIDMRSDWCTRKLPRGSPVGGDRATWWTASEPLQGRLLTAKTRVDEPARFDWKVNEVALHADRLESTADGPKLLVSVAAYSPRFAGFEVSTDRGPWEELRSHTLALGISPGEHSLRVRVRTDAGSWGPESRAEFRFEPAARKDAG